MRPWIRNGAAIFAVMGLSVAGFFTCFERAPDWRYRGASHEARTQPFLALGRFLERMGHAVHYLDGPADLEQALPPHDATLFYPVYRLTLGAERSRLLLDWVEAGGHLWVVTYSIWDDDDRRPDLILDPLGVHQFMADTDDEADEADTGEPDEGAGADELEAILSEELDLGGETAEDGPVPPEVLVETWPAVTWERVDVGVGDGDEVRAMWFDSRFWLESEDTEPLYALRGAAGIHQLVVSHGRGLVTVNTDDYYLRNAGLGLEDHADLALRALRFAGAEEGTRAPVWMLLAERWPSPLELLRQHAWAFMAGCAVLLTAWLLRASRRFGPEIAEAPPVRRSLLEHVETAGHLLARRRRDLLLDATRDAVRDEIRHRRQGWMRLPPDELTERLAHATGLSPDSIHLALESPDAGTSLSSFTRAVATLQGIRSRL